MFQQYASQHAQHLKQGWQGSSNPQQQYTAGQPAQASPQQTSYHPVSPVVYNYAAGGAGSSSPSTAKTVFAVIAFIVCMLVSLVGNFHYGKSLPSANVYNVPPPGAQEQQRMSGQDYFDKANEYFDQKNYAAAAPLYQSALTEYAKEYSGVVNYNCARGRYMLGCCNFYMKKYPDAISDLANALATYQQVKGKDDQQTADVMNALAVLI